MSGVLNSSATEFKCGLSMSNQLIVFADRTHALVAAAGERASYRFLEFFTATIRNPNTRRAYARAAVEFFDWLEARGVTHITAVESVHVAAYIEQLQKARSAPTAKLHLAALRHLFDWLVVGQIMPVNPAAAVRGPRHIVRRGKTPVLDPAEARQLIDAIDATTVIGLRDRALIGLMVNSFARIGAAIGMRVDDVYSQNRRLWVHMPEFPAPAAMDDMRSAQGLLRFVRLLGRRVNRHGFWRLVGNGKALNCHWVLLSGNRPFGGRSSICPGTEFDDGKPDGMIFGRENGRASMARFG